MTALIWKHGMSKNDARQLIQARIEKAGIRDKVLWKGDSFSSSIGWGTILNLEGQVTDESVILKKAAGALGSIVLEKSREAFQELFPNGERPISSDSEPVGV